MSIAVYDLKRVAAVFGVVPISVVGGYGESDAFNWKQVEDDFGTKVGADGIITRYAINNPLAEIEVTTMQTSKLNALLSGIRLLDINTPGGAGIMPFSIADLQGTTLLVCSSAWIAGPPECPFGKEAQERKWKINGEIASMLVGGN